MKIVARSFFQRPTEAAARDLLGLLLCHRTPAGLLVGRIVETEAYLGRHDAASHAARGQTVRNRVMFEAPGHAYVYFSYGMHWCMNVVAYDQPPGGVLIRALEPLEGADEMGRRRGLKATSRQLTNGPGKLTQALGIVGEHNGMPLYDNASPLFISRPARRPRAHIAVTPRIGISRCAELPLRFVLADSAYVSRRVPTAS